MGVDQAAVSGWLLDKWQFPERTQHVVSASHEPDKLTKQSSNGMFARCVALASAIAEVFLDTSGEPSFAALAERAERYFDIDKEGLAELLEEIRKMIPDAESIFETQILSATRSDEILDEANGIGDLGRHFGGHLYEREVTYLMREEWARTAEDILWRRTKEGLHLHAEQRTALADWMAGRRVNAA